ncbi:MAG: divalent metal cation transporter [Balneolaceae bacterium]|nr:divalent metal cation transporter [Balneolaceae bacterium]
MNKKVNRDEDSRLLEEIQSKGLLIRVRTYLRLSGPGFLQSAISLGGGSMASSLYLGVLAGYSMLWLQPLGMLLGIIMLSAIGYITLVTSERPFQAINKHVNPVLGWAWALASLLASIVWAMPQFALAFGAIKQNLMPGTFGINGVFGGTGGMILVSIGLLALTLAISWNYDRGRTGVRVYEWILKGVVAVIILSFVGVVIRLTFVADMIDWGEISRGFIPNFSLFFRPAEGFLPMLESLSETSRMYWTDVIVSRQQNIMAAAISNAVGINMTFLFAYSMLRRNWGREYHGMMRFDLAFGLLIPFILVTSCVMIASTSQFHTIPQPGIIEEYSADWEPAANQIVEYNQLLENRILHESIDETLSQEQLSSQVEALSREDHIMAATLITRDAFDLSFSLEPLLGSVFGHLIFGIGVLGMALSSITLMMIISGMVVCEVLGKPRSKWAFCLGTLLPGFGVLGPFFWNYAYFWLAIPVSVITFFLLPIAYVTFLLMINNKALMGEHMPKGKYRIVWNTLMIGAVILITTASFYMLWVLGGYWGILGFLIFISIVGIADFKKRKNIK